MRNARSAVKRWISPKLLNQLLLRCPFLYRLPIIRYESNLEETGLSELYELADRATSVPGVILECGSSRAGSAVLLAKHLDGQGRPRQIIALDSFAGFPEDEVNRERAEGLSDPPPNAFTSTSFEYVVAKLRRLGLTEKIRPVGGFFQDTLAPVAAEAGQVALAFIDCDLEESTRFCAETIWPRLPSGGILAFDDYTAWIAGDKKPVLESFLGSKRAVDAFVEDHLGEIADHGLMRRLYYVEKS